jgi:hypothetical protein
MGILLAPREAVEHYTEVDLTDSGQAFSDYKTANKSRGCG